MKALLTCYILLAAYAVYGQDRLEEHGYIKDVSVTRAGIVFTDNYGSVLYLVNGAAPETLATGAGCGVYYTISPEGRYLGYKRITAAGQQPVVLDLQTRQHIPLAEPAPLCSRVTFANNGAMAYAVGNTVYMVKSFIPSARLQLPAYANYISLSPDGGALAANDDADRIYIIDTHTGSVRYASPAGTACFYPEWSADGNYLAYVTGSQEVFAVNAATCEARSLGIGGRASAVPGTSAFLFTRKAITDMRLSGSALVVADAAAGTAATLAPDGQLPAYAAVSGGQVVFTTIGAKTIFTATLADGGLRGVTAAADYSGTLNPVPLQPHTTIPIEELDIPYVNQVYDTPDWYNGHSACGPTSSIMVIAYYKLLPKWDGWCSTPSGHYNSWGRYVSDKYRFRQFDYALMADDPNGTPSYGGYGYMWSTGSPHSRMVGYYNNHLISASLAESPAITLAEAEVTAGRPYTLCNGLTTAGHIIVVHGVNSAQRTVVANDPYGNKNNPGYPNYSGKNARYDWPGYNNGYQNLNTVYWGVTAQAPTPAAADSVVDDLQFDRGFYLNNRYPATMASWKDMNQGYNNHFWYGYTKANAPSDTLYALWQPMLVKTGYYWVKAYIPFSNATDARYKVQGADGISTVSINQKQYSSAWVSLGRFRFLAGATGTVRLGDASSEAGKEIVFDAMKWEYIDSVLSGTGPAQRPNEFTLEQNYPNPFNPATVLRFTLHERAHVTLAVYTATGELAAELVNGVREAGSHAEVFTAANLPSGVYFARLRAAGQALTIRMLLIK